MSSTITWKTGENELTDYITHGLSLNAIETFVRDIAQYSNAEINQVTFTVGQAIENIAAQPGDYPTVKLFAKIFLRETDTQTLYCAIIRAPKKAIFIDTPDGLRISPHIGRSIASKYALMAGTEFTFAYGALCGSTE